MQYLAVVIVKIQNHYYESHLMYIYYFQYLCPAICFPLIGHLQLLHLTDTQHAYFNQFNPYPNTLKDWSGFIYPGGGSSLLHLN